MVHSRRALLRVCGLLGAAALAPGAAADHGGTDTGTAAGSAEPGFSFAVFPTPPRAGERLHFFVVTQTNQRRVIDASWDFDGDGETDWTGYEGQHTYEEPGEKVVTLRARETNGPIRTVTRTLEVLPPESETGTEGAAAPYEGGDGSGDGAGGDGDDGDAAGGDAAAALGGDPRWTHAFGEGTGLAVAAGAVGATALALRRRVGRGGEEPESSDD